MQRRYVRGLPTELELWRRRRGLLVRELAERIGVSRQYVSLIERGRTDPSERVRQALSNVLGVPVEVLFPEDR